MLSSLLALKPQVISICSKVRSYAIAVFSFMIFTLLQVSIADDRDRQLCKIRRSTEDLYNLVSNTRMILDVIINPLSVTTQLN